MADKIINGSESTHTRGVGNSEVHGGGGKKSISTVKQIYLMCRKYTEYNGFCTNKILADERNFEENEGGIVGKK